MTMKSKYTKPIMSREDLARFQGLDEDSKRELSTGLDSFEQDALEGFSQFPQATDSLKKLDNRFISKKGMGYSWMLVVATTLTSLVLLILLFSEKTKNAEIISQADEQLKIEESDFIENRIDTLQEISAEKQITKSDLPVKAQIPKSQKTDNSTKLDAEIYIVDKLPELKKEVKIYEAEKKIASKRFAAKEYYPEDLKLVDYRAYRNSNIVETRQLELIGLPANMEDENDEQDEMVWKDVNIPYDEYIRKTLRYFNKGNYKKALSRFETVIKSYPDDINALFYGGLCYYNLGNNENAIEYFQKTAIHTYSNFDEEALWFLALSYRNLKLYDKAKGILKEISASKGFYAKQAANLLEK